MVVLHHLKVTITNLPTEVTRVQIPDFPANPDQGTHEVAFNSVIYIERDDFKEVRLCVCNIILLICILYVVHMYYMLYMCMFILHR